MDKSGLWQAEVPEVREGKWYFRQLFVNGKRKQRARTPNEGYYRIEGESPQDKPVKIKFKPGEIKKEWADDGDVEVVALLAWAELRMQIRSVDESNHVATLSGNPRPSNKENNAKYYIENAPDALDKPGEWYLNRKTGIVTYWAEPGEKPDEAVITAPKLTELVRFKGDFEAGKAVQHVVIRGITFADADWELAQDGYADTQAAVGIRGDIWGEGVVDCLIEDCVFTRLGGYALDFGRGCKQIRIVGNEIYDLGAGGVRLGEPTRRESEFDQNEDNVVTDNHMYQLGVVYPAAVGVLVFHSGHNRIAHNHIH
ncbi:MAG TPA: right-handed parallel beta-helix repeat-containing protein, partial [Verrucomicrobiota bacterium]|nr:right-handed parallel beta-helix repeat-containing protein [Verrucomicrobiota bacterium]